MAIASLPVALFGATGRMGGAVVLAAADASVHIVGACAGSDSAGIGRDVGEYSNTAPNGVRISADPASALAGARAAIDFSLPQATSAVARACAVAGIPLVSGVTGFGDEQQRALNEAARAIPVLHAPNLSVGVAVLDRLAELAARHLDPSFEIEILEAHHRAKRDAPSGTALHLGATVATARGADLDAVRTGPERDGPRDPTQIGFSVVRAGDIAGEHTVMFAGQGERIELTHRAHSRAAFARGALLAARWLAEGRPPGRYSLRDALGL
jgi:4-hydroxy-tetrahydrodipicolinate reductase